MKIFNKCLIVFAFSVCPFSLVLGQENGFISRIKTQLFLYRTQKADQSIVVQTDKTLYRQGETIWMKAYVTNAITHFLSLNSLELMMQITDNKGVNLFEGKFLLKNGVADFNYLIPPDLPHDIYYLTAYTPEIEGIGIQDVYRKKIFIGRPEHFNAIPQIEYSKPFYIPESKESATIRLKDLNGKPVSGKKFEYQIINEDRELLSGDGKTGANGTGEVVFLTPSQKNGSPMMVSLDISSGIDRINLVSKIPLASEKINITFFPDGGRMVRGIQQMIVYEARDQIGNPVNIKADIINAENDIVATTSTIQPGLGVFSLPNTYNKRMVMRISSDIGKDQETELPPFSLGSMSITVTKNDGKNLSLLLGRSPQSEITKFVMVVAANGEMIWASDFVLAQSGVLNVPLENFQTEFADVAIFDSTGILVAQRLIYTGKSQSVNITFSPDKSIYKKGEKGEIKVKVTGPDGKPVKAELAAGLTDKYTFAASATAVENLKYGLDKPFLFKESPDKINRIVLNYHLATAHLKGFDWSQVVAIDPAKTLNIRMGGIRVSGTVTDTKNSPVAYALVSLTSPSLQQFNVRSDQHGEFVINLPVSVEKKNLSASATDASGKGNYRVTLNKSFKDELMNSLNNTSVNDWSILEQMYQSEYFKANPNFFKPFPSIKVKSPEKAKGEPYWQNYLSSSSSILEVIKTIRPYELMNGKIVFRGINSLNAQDGALIVIDGQKIGTDPGVLSMINPHDVADIQILLNPVEMSKYTALNSVGIIEITTKRGEVSNDPVKNADQSIEIFSKQFKPVSIGNDKYDLKTTLQWIPVLFTDENGEVSVPFTAGGIKSTFVLEIAGFTDQGQWIGNQTEITVE